MQWGLSLNETAPSLSTKSADWQAAENPARQGGKPAKEGACPVASDRILQVKPTQQAKSSPTFSSVGEDFAFAGFVSGLGAVSKRDSPQTVFSAGQIPGVSLNYDSADTTEGTSTFKNRAMAEVATS